jgi:hypothetical protein
VRIEPTAFLAIEGSMAGAMKAQWDKLAADIVPKLHDALETKDYARAQEIANRLTMDGVVRRVRPRLEELAVSALLFGAHRVTGDVHKTVYASGEPVPQALHNGLSQLEHAVEMDAAEYVRASIHKLIDDLKRADATAHMQKDDIYAQPSKRPDAQTAEETPPEPDETGEQVRRREKFAGFARWVKEGDISDEQLAETGSLQEPEQGRKKRKRQTVTKKEGPKTLYVNRPLMNAADVIAWAKEQGFKSAQKPEDMHVTLCYSKQPFDWDHLEPDAGAVMVKGGPRAIQQFNKGAVVLEFDSPDLAAEHQGFRAAGASYDFATYRPHITITWEGAPRDVSQIEPYQGDLVFGPQEFKPINKDWQKDHEETKLNKADTRTLAERINDCVVNGGRVPADLSASLTTSRLISLGFLCQATSQGVIRYRVDEVLDDRTCQVCAMMHGKVFNVADQMARTVQALSTGDPADLKVLAPWPSQSAENIARMQGMSNSDLQSAGLGAPPYHAGCRGLLAEIGEDAEDFSAQAMDLAQDIIEGAGSSAAEDEIKPAAPKGAAQWSDAVKDKIGWERFDVTDPEAFAAVDDAFQAGDYDLAQRLIDEWKDKQVEKGEDSVPPPTTSASRGRTRARKSGSCRCLPHASSITTASAPTIAPYAVQVMNDLDVPIERVS